MHAAAAGNAKIVQTLLDADAEVNKQDDRGFTAFLDFHRFADRKTDGRSAGRSLSSRRRIGGRTQRSAARVRSTAEIAASRGR